MYFQFCCTFEHIFHEIDFNGYIFYPFALTIFSYLLSNVIHDTSSSCNNTGVWNSFCLISNSTTNYLLKALQINYPHTKTKVVPDLVLPPLFTGVVLVKQLSDLISMVTVHSSPHRPLIGGTENTCVAVCVEDHLKGSFKVYTGSK